MMSTTACVAAAESDLASPESLAVDPGTTASADSRRPKRRTLRGWMSSSLVSRMPSLKAAKSIATTDHHTSDYSIQVSSHLKNQDLEDGKSSNRSDHEEAPAEDDVGLTSCSEGASVSSSKGLDLPAGPKSVADLGEKIPKVSADPAKERVTRCLPGMEDDDEYTTCTMVFDCKMWESIPEYSKSNLMIGKHLGKGSFSDVFEVVTTVVVEKKSLDSLDKDDLDTLIEAKFAPSSNDNAGAVEYTQENEDSSDKDDLDKLIEAKFAPLSIGNDSSKPQEVKTDTRPCYHNRRQNRALQHGVAASLCVRNINQPAQTRQVTYAMKCLRPQIRWDKEKFAVGIDDLFHETVILAALDHPNIIKIHGRARGERVSALSGLSDGYFILLDRLADTLEDRMMRWGQIRDTKTSLSLKQIKTAWTIADALAYLHSKKIVFRDLKPANVGFNSTGVLKLFDFGFAVFLDDDEPSEHPSRTKDNANHGNSHLLYDRCGTLRYMAPEVGLASGYSIPADVYSFGILLWEVCALKKPFAHLKSGSEFSTSVFDKGVRPKLSKHWPQELTDTMSKCWSSFQEERPQMESVKMSLGETMREGGPCSRLQGKRGSVLRRSSVFGRLTLP